MSSTPAPPASRGTRAQQDPAPADRGDLAGIGAAARRARRRTAPGIAIRLYARGRLRDARRVHRARDPAHEPGIGHPADALARASATSRRSPSSRRPTRAASRPRSTCSSSSARCDRPRRRRPAPRDGGSDDRATLTDLGREIARLPIDPRFARMLIEAKRTGVLADVMPIVAGMSIQDVRERPEERREEADRLHARFTDPTSDFLSLLNLWNHLQEQQAALGSSAFRRLCRAEHLNYVRVREWADVHRQLSAIVGAARRGRQWPRRPTPTTSTRRSSRACSRTSASSTSARRARRRADGRRRCGCRHQKTRPAQRRLPRRARRAIRDLPRIGPAQEAPHGGHGRGARRDVPPVRPNRRRDRPGLGRAARRRPRQAAAERAALVEDGGRGIRLREGDPVRRRDHPTAPRAARPLRPAVRARAVRAPRAGRRRLGRLPSRQAPHRIRAPQPRAAAAAREDRRARAAPRHPRRRRGGLPVLRRAAPAGRVRRAIVRGVVDGMPRPARRGCST